VNRKGYRTNTETSRERKDGSLQTADRSKKDNEKTAGGSKDKTHLGSLGMH
jgi:hypothetical protein